MATQRTKWTLQRDSFDLLLQALGPDRDAAGEAYERLRKRLVKFFSWERCPEPESCADESLNRIARALERGENVQKMDHYALGVARLVLLEARTQMRKIAATQVHLQPAGGADAGPESALACLDECMDALDRDQRALLIEYYRGHGKTRIENRRRLAEQLGIELNALRNRAMRLRERVETCVRARLEQKGK
jgi:DNA-directed RNA polymerase specialized sigma24 family protein